MIKAALSLLAIVAALTAAPDAPAQAFALHNPTLDDQPRLFFMQFRLNDDAAKLVRGLRTALDKVNAART